MQNKKRNNAKWLPFNSVCDTKMLVDDLNNIRKKVKMPSLSEEQRIIIENKIIKAFYEDDVIKISYYKSGYIFEIKDKVKKIDSVYHKIYFENNTLLFDQIVNIKNLN